MPTVVALSFIVLGSVLFSIILVVICGKRIIYQRKDCSKRDAHIPGQETKKSLRREIERRIDRVADIVYEPKLIQFTSEKSTSNEFPPYYFRMKAVDNMKYLEEELKSLESVPPKHPHDNIRAFLVSLTLPGYVLSFVEPRLIHELCDQYDHARQGTPPFGVEEFTTFHSLLSKILHSARRKDKSSGRMTSSTGGKAPSDHDSAIDDPDQSGDDENLLVCDTNLVLLQRPPSRRTPVKDDSFETPV